MGVQAPDNRDRDQMLRDWYLASLRQAVSRAHQRLMTPATLVGKDRQLIEDLVSRHTQNTNSADVLSANASRRRIRNAESVIVVIAIVLAILSAGVLVLSVFADLHNDMRFGAIGILSLQVIGLSAIAWLAQSQVIQPVRRVADALVCESGSAPPSRDILDLLRDAAAQLHRQSAESQLKERAIFDAATEMVFCLNKELQIVACNQAFCATLSMPMEDLLARHLIDLIVFDDVDRACSQFAKLAETNLPERFDLRLLANGSARDLDCSVEWSSTEQHYFATARDVTAEKVLERAKREFIAMLGHDIRIPLTSIVCNLQMLAESSGDHVNQSNVPLQACLRSSRRLMVMVNELLDYEKARAGKLVLSLETVCLADLIDEAIAETSGQAEAARVTVHCSDLSERCEVRADPAKILRAIVNLLSNAIKYSPANQSVVVACLSKGNYVEVRVTDNGPGISALCQDLVFERYERVATDGASAVEGTGLGLAIARAIVQSHGGLIGVDSKVGEGSTFWVSLPRAR